MKRTFFLFFAGLAVCTFMNAQTLDEAILGAAVKIGADLPDGATVAVIHFRSEKETLNDYVINELHGILLRNRRVTPVKPDESQFQNIRGELRFNEAGEIDGESVRGIGRLLRAQYLVTGSLETAGSGYGIIFTAVDTVGAEIRSRYTASLNSSDATLVSLLGITPARERQSRNIDPEEARLNTLGFGVDFVTPDFGALALAGTVRWTFAPLESSFFELGMSLGGTLDLPGFYFNPFAGYSFFRPFAKGGGWHIGGRLGYTHVVHGNPGAETTINAFSFDVSTGWIFRNGITFSIAGVLGPGKNSSYEEEDTFLLGIKIAVGWSYRFKKKQPSAQPATPAAVE
jgi:hypothetical protein